MANFLYGPDKVDLPALPEFEEQYALIFRTNVDGAYVYYLVPLTEAKKAITSGAVTFTNSRDMYRAENGKWVAVTKSYTGGIIIWANYDVYYSDSVEEVGGTLYLAASDPVPVSPVQLNPADVVQGYFVGMAVKRSRK